MRKAATARYKPSLRELLKSRAKTMKRYLITPNTTSRTMFKTESMMIDFYRKSGAGRMKITESIMPTGLSTECRTLNRFILK